MLGSILAQDRYLPRQLHTRGDRLAFSNGIVFLAVFAIVLIVAFKAEVTSLIQLYIVGVFVSFTLSQAGMLRHWNRLLRTERDPTLRRRMFRSRAINAFGMVLTGAVLVVVLATKFLLGAWIAIAAMAVLYLVMGSKLSADADSLVAPLSEALLHWRAAPDSWSVAQCIEHLNVTARLYLPVSRRRDRQRNRRGLYGPGPFRYNWIGRLVVFSQEPPPRFRTRAPAAFTPAAERPRKQIIGGVPRLPGAIHRSPAPGQRHRSLSRARPLAVALLGAHAARLRLRLRGRARAAAPLAGA